MGCAKTGSGKTAAFVLPVLQKLSGDPYGIFCLVLTPTRLVLLDHTCCFTFVSFQGQRPLQFDQLVGLINCLFIPVPPPTYLRTYFTVGINSVLNVQFVCFHIVSRNIKSERKPQIYLFFALLL